MSAVSVVSIDSSSHHSFTSSHMMDTAAATSSSVATSSSSSSSSNSNCSQECAEYAGGASSSQSSITASVSEHNISSGAAHPAAATISNRRFHRRKLKLDIKSAQAVRRSPNHLHPELLLPNLNTNTSSSAPSSSSIVTVNELNYSQGLRPIENQITNPNFIRSRKTVSLCLVFYCDYSVV